MGELQSLRIVIYFVRVAVLHMYLGDRHNQTRAFQFCRQLQVYLHNLS
jgi:hypothetical protein